MALLFIMVASLALAPGANETIVTTNQDDEPRACCMAITAECLACTEGKTPQKFCETNPTVTGCERYRVPQEVKAELQENAEDFKARLMAQYGNDTEALRAAYQEHAKEMIQAYKGDVDALTREYKAQSSEELKGYIEARKEMAKIKMDANKEQIKAKVQERIQEENEVRLAVQTMLAMENMTGKMGPQVKEIATEMNARVQTATQLKEKAADKGGLSRFFAGGDTETAQQLHEEAAMYQKKVQELKQLKEQANLDEETKAIFEEQLNIMEQEQTRLRHLANKEDNRGILGWLWKNKVSAEESVVVE